MTDAPLLTVVVPTRNRPDAVGGAVASALAQTLPDVEVVVVDDASDPPVELDPDPRVRVVRRDERGGVSAARNSGLEVACGRYVTFLDDDNRLHPDMAAASLEAIRASSLPPPVGAISALEVIRGGRVADVRIPPPAHPRGDHFSLEALPDGRSHMTKCTLVVEREVLLAIGGFDPDFGSRQQSDLFLRLNPVCSLVGLDTVTTRVDREPRPRLSRQGERSNAGVRQLVEKHRALLAEHPRGHADVWLGHARMSLAHGPRRAVVPSIARAFRAHPRHTAAVLLDGRRLWRALVTLKTTG